MSRIKITDLPQKQVISKEDMKKIKGGFFDGIGETSLITATEGLMHSYDFKQNKKV